MSVKSELVEVKIRNNDISVNLDVFVSIFGNDDYQFQIEAIETETDITDIMPMLSDSYLELIRDKTNEKLRSVK